MPHSTPRPFAARRRAATLAVAPLAAILAAACADYGTAPSSNPGEQALRTENEGSWEPVGSAYTIPAPQIRGHTGQQGALDYTPTTFVLTERQKVRIRVRGEYTLTQNPQMLAICSEDAALWGIPNDDCTRAPIGPVGPLGIPYSSLWGGSLQTWVILRTPYDYVWIYLQPVEGDPFAAEAVQELPPGTIQVARSGFSCYYHGWVSNRVEGCYQFGGGMTLTVEREGESAELALECKDAQGRNRVPRGTPVTCTARKDPADSPSPLVITGWSFDGKAREDGDPTSPDWTGPLVKGGTVQVTATIGGEQKSATATLVVDDRTWSGVPVMHMREMPESGQEERVPALASRISWASDLGAFRAYLEPPPGEEVEDVIHTVAGGPNDGLSYFGDLSFAVWGRIRTNDAAMRRGSGFYNRQEQGTGSGGTQLGGARWCPARVVASVLPGRVMAHERRHAEVYRQTFAEVVAPVLTELEQMTGTYDELADRYDPLRAEADRKAIDASLAIHDHPDDHPDNLVSVSDGGRPCNLKNEDGALLRNPPKETATR